MADEVTLLHGYQRALLGRVTTMHAEYYGANYGFGLEFETKVGSEMAEFLTRVSRPQNEVWAAVRQGQIIGSISIGGEDIGNGVAHLRWFVMDEGARGSGAGKRLLKAALAFVDEQGFHETHLWTFKGLDAARRLYEQTGFTLSSEKAGTQWGSEVPEQKFIRTVW